MDIAELVMKLAQAALIIIIAVDVPMVFIVMLVFVEGMASRLREARSFGSGEARRGADCEPEEPADGLHRGPNEPDRTSRKQSS